MSWSLVRSYFCAAKHKQVSTRTLLFCAFGVDVVHGVDSVHVFLPSVFEVLFPRQNNNVVWHLS